MKTLKSLRIPCTSVAQYITTASHSTESFGGFVCPALLCTHQLRVHDVVDTFSEGPRHGSSNRLCFLSCCIVVRQTLSRDIERRIEAFGSKWHDECLSNRRLLHETEPRPNNACIVRQPQVMIYEPVAPFPEVDPAHEVVL